MDKAWRIYYFEIFYEQYIRLIAEVVELKKKDPKTYKFHKKTKILARIRSVIKNQIAKDPKSKDFHLGAFLPKQYRSFKRAKSGLPNRYRLFFRYKSSEGKIVIIWMNNEFTLRNKGGKKDVYATFYKMLNSKTVPSNWKSLLYKAKIPPELKTKRIP